MILVTGSSGFIGGHLCRTLSERSVDYRTAGRSALPGGTTVGPLGAETDWRDAVAGADTVVHLAARVHVMRDAAADPLAVFRAVNVAGTLKLANDAADAGVKRFVFLSSIKVNGEGTTLDKAYRFDDPPRPIDPYGVSKLEAELALFELGARRSMEIAVVRPVLVYGPGVKANFRQLIRMVDRGLPLPLGSVRNLRSLVAVDNLVDLVITCTTHPRAAGQVFLVSDGEDLSTADLLRRLARAVGQPSRLWPFPPGLMAAAAAALGRRAVTDRLLGSLRVDIDHTREALDWRPPVPVDAALAATVAAYRADHGT